MKSFVKFLYVKKSKLPNAGKGLFTKTNIPKGSLIIEYKGKITTWEDADHDNGENAYIYYINKNHVIDAKADKGMLARFANDARGLKRLKEISNNCSYMIIKKKVFIKAFRDIAPYEEILVGYGKTYWEVIKKNSGTR